MRCCGCLSNGCPVSRAFESPSPALQPMHRSPSSRSFAFHLPIGTRPVDVHVRRPPSATTVNRAHTTIPHTSSSLQPAKDMDSLNTPPLARFRLRGFSRRQIMMVGGAVIDKKIPRRVKRAAGGGRRSNEGFQRRPSLRAGALPPSWGGMRAALLPFASSASAFPLAFRPGKCYPSRRFVFRSLHCGERICLGRTGIEDRFIIRSHASGSSSSGFKE